ncbi:MAG: LysR family transcriptional regulator [Polyangiaceae bacterium]
MLDEIDALSALAQLGTISEAAVRLRLTQSAVSKRLKALEQRVGHRLLEPDGRRVRLTAHGLSLVERARPLVAELRALSHPAPGLTLSSLSLALADSVASSWGPGAVRRALDGVPGLRVDLHAHRSVLVIESVLLGRYQAGLCTAPPPTRDLVQHPVAREPMVLVRSGLAARAAKGRPLISIEPTSATYRAIAGALREHHPELAQQPIVPVESFGAVLQMVKAGFGDGLLPSGLLREARLPRRSYRVLSRVARDIALVTRKTIAELPSFQALCERLAHEAQKTLG